MRLRWRNPASPAKFHLWMPLQVYATPKGRPWGECWFLLAQDDRHTGDGGPTGSAVRIRGSAVVHEGQECPTCLLLCGHSSSIPFLFHFPSSAREPDPKLRWGGHISKRKVSRPRAESPQSPPGEVDITPLAFMSFATAPLPATASSPEVAS